MKIKRIVFLLFAVTRFVYAQDPNTVFLPCSPASDIKLAEDGRVDAMLRLGYAYMTGSAGTHSSQLAAQYFGQASQLHASGASAWLGYVAITSATASASSLNGLNLIQAAANAGDPVASTLLGRLYQLGQVLPKNLTQAQTLYTGVGSKFALAQTFLGEMLLTTAATTHDYLQALELFQLAAAAGETTSMLHISEMYLQGRGVQQDSAEAIRWLERAMALGNRVAYYRRGILYRDGVAGLRSYSSAAVFIGIAAQAGYAPAQAAYGRLYALGLGVKKDLPQAIQWLTLAAPQYPYAAKLLAQIRAGLFP